MFRSLRIKLTVLYAGLFCIALALIGATSYAVIGSNTQRLVRTQIETSKDVFMRTWELQTRQLQDGARIAAAQQNFQQALISRDSAAIHTALSTLRARLGADIIFAVTPEGLVIGEDGIGASSVSPGLQISLDQDADPVGVLSSGGILHHAVTAPVTGAGWVVAGVRLDADAMASIEELSSIPLKASTFTRTIDGAWADVHDPDGAAINAFISEVTQLENRQPRLLQLPSGGAIASIEQLPSLDGTRSILMLRFPLSNVLSPYRALFNSLFAIGIVGVILLVVGSWFLARSITQPISSLEEAARKLQEGAYEPVQVKTKDEVAHLAGSFNAMIGAIGEREKRIMQLAYHDAETRLPNRLALERKLGAATQVKRLYLAAIGIDRFAHVRGAIGYTLAGMLVRKLGGRLARIVPNAPMARLSSDTLCVAFLADNEPDARKRGHALISNLEQPLALDGQVVDVNVSVGIAQPRAKEETPAHMIERASIALDQARSARTSIAFFDEAAYGDPARNLSLMGEMRQALESGAIYLAHQPKYNFRDGRINSAETLVRWKHPTRGLIPPDLFVPMAEETGHVRALTEWALRQTVADQKQLSQVGWPLALSVNVSGRLIGDADFAQAAIAIVREAPHEICFEITETAVIDNPAMALKNIELFAANGVKIAIDDYGSGLSSLSYLKQLPAHELKIDKVFVENISASRRDALLVRSTIDLGHGLGLKVTAEGVENPSVFSMLASMGCDMAQGYLIARPSPIDEVLSILNDDSRMQFYQQTARAAHG